MAVTINGTNGVVFNDSSTQNTAATGFGFKNRLINSAMVIDQRNAGASVTPTNGAYTLDRWKFSLSQASKFTSQQNQGSVTPPVGFINYLGLTSSSAYSSLSSDYFWFEQLIEGLNFSDMAWGTANAQTVTLSFKVYSSLTGTWSGSIANSAQDRSYPFSYTVSSANTWTTVSVTISGDTSGTWLTTNGIGARIRFDFGTGSTYRSTAGSWQAGQYLGVTGSNSLVGTNGATFYITGVQLEKGSTATSFDYRPYGTELQLCQRYFEIIGSTANSVLFQTYAAASSSGSQRSTLYYKVSKRAAPTATIVGTWSYSNAANLTVVVAGIDASRVEWDASGAGICFAYNLNTGAYLSFASEL